MAKLDLVFMGLLLVLLVLVSVCDGGMTSMYVRRKLASVDMPLNSTTFPVPKGNNAPQQVHITQGDLEGKAVIVTWTTPSYAGLSVVNYGEVNTTKNYTCRGSYTKYKFYNYTSGYIHHCNLKDLKYNTQYWYEVGLLSSPRKFTFKTPPPVGPDSPYIFGLIGDLGQTYDSNITLSHYEQSKGQAVLFLGDLSYADNYPFHDNARWDTWGRFVERNAAYQTWIWTVGNHEIDFVPEINETVPYKPFLNRYQTPYLASNSTEPFFYSVKRGPAHIIVLASYSAYGKYTPQYVWLQKELAKVNRTVTPWLIVTLHSPWYNSYNYHYMEGETMRVQFEAWMVQYKVDVVFAGHVHAYERSKRISNIAYNITNAKCLPVLDENAPIYLTVGDGGNIEGIANNMTEPQPNYSAFREASFGHGLFDIKNKTHAYFTWHRNQDNESVIGDSHWFYNRYWFNKPEPESHT